MERLAELATDQPSDDVVTRALRGFGADFAVTPPPSLEARSGPLLVACRTVLVPICLGGCAWAVAVAPDDVYVMRMARVNITVPDEIAARARAAGLNVSGVATAAHVEELDRREKIEALDAHLTQLERELGPISIDEQASAAAWADQVLTPRPAARTSPRRRRSA